MKTINEPNTDPIALLACELGVKYETLESPNYNERKNKQTGGLVERPTILVIHYTACEKEVATQVFMTPHQTSAHYLVDRQGNITRFVSEDQRAWHAGVGYWKGNEDINGLSIGIENVNLGYKQEKEQPNGIAVKGSSKEWYPYDTALLQILGPLCQDIIKRYAIRPDCVLCHSDLATFSETGYLGRKVDPGPFFPWESFYRQYKVGAWYNLDKPFNKVTLPGPTEQDRIQWVQVKLNEYGYKCPQTGEVDTGTTSAIQAFQLHFRPSDISGTIDEETIRILASLVDQYIYV